MYKVFEIDTCFEEYAANSDLVGGESVQDILDHFGEIYPDYKEKVERDEWMSDEDWDELSEYGKYKDGDVKSTPYFDRAQMDSFKESLDPDCAWKRIKEIPHLFTDTPYTRITGYGYCE